MFDLLGRDEVLDVPLDKGGRLVVEPILEEGRRRVLNFSHWND